LDDVPNENPLAAAGGAEVSFVSLPLVVVVPKVNPPVVGGGGGAAAEEEEDVLVVVAVVVVPNANPPKSEVVVVVLVVAAGVAVDDVLEAAPPGLGASQDGHASYVSSFKDIHTEHFHLFF